MISRWAYSGYGPRSTRSRWRDALTARGYVSSQALTDCAQGQRVQLIGTLVMHQAPPTAKGFHFLTVEDELGLANVIVRPHIAARDRSAMRGGCDATG